MANRIPNSICAYCKNPYYRRPSQKDHIHCSTTCRMLNAGPIKSERTCPNCGKKFFRKRSKPNKFCSIACFNTYTKTLPDRICAVCGKPFRGRRYLGSYQAHCSLKCAGVPQSTSVVSTCAHCGKEYRKPPSLSGQFCSIACSNLARDTKITLVCNNCKKEFRVSPCYEKQKFCSTECAKIAKPPYRRFWDKLKNGTRTDIEAALESVLQELGVTYVWEQRFGKYFVDFYLPDQKIAIECDEPYWHDADHDAKKDKWIMDRYQTPVIRWLGVDIKNHGHDLVRSIIEAKQK